VLQPESVALGQFIWGTTPSNSPVYGPDDPFSARVALQTTTRNDVEIVRQQIVSGQRMPGDTPYDARYTAGDPGLQNPNFRRDMTTALFMAYASTDDRVKLVLGSYDMKISVLSVEGDRARVKIVASNTESLGSAFGFHIPVWSDYLYSDDRTEGMFHPVEQEFQYEETIDLAEPVPGNDLPRQGGR
ncbi:MAG TPA: hypothetical protein VFT74_14620, partial [Isosphaeraceae bacterium]|nr:hypothetical protein [Isosphaeraceae bacterium]